jgi:hypothetical protein
LPVQFSKILLQIGFACLFIEMSVHVFIVSVSNILCDVIEKKG